MNLSAIMQPTFLPWIGYFDLIDQVEIFVFYDDVQLSKRSWQVRNRIKSANGELYLTVPIEKSKQRDELLICEAQISYDENWQYKHLKSLEYCYKKAKHFETVYKFMEDHYSKKDEWLSLFNQEFIVAVSERIGISTTFITSSSLTNIEGSKDVRLASICEKLSSSEYLSPQGSAHYIESESPGGWLTKKGISLYYHFYQHPVYSQRYGEFQPYMSIVDLLFNEGFDNTLEIIRQGRQERIHYQTFREQFFKQHQE